MILYLQKTGYRPNSVKVFTLFGRLLTPSTCVHMESLNFAILFPKTFFVHISPQASSQAYSIIGFITILSKTLEGCVNSTGVWGRWEPPNGKQTRF